MDEHARRVTHAFRDAWEAFQCGRATLLDLSRTARQAAAALDNGNQSLRSFLEAAWGDLEYAYHASEQAEHVQEARRILEPVLTEMNAAEPSWRPSADR